MARRIGFWLSAISMVLTAGPVPAFTVHAPVTGTIAGRVFQSDAKTPVRAAVVKAFNRASESTVESSVTGPDGAYAIEGLAPGEYDLGISTQAGIFVVDATMTVGSGQKRAASFALHPDAQEEQAGDGTETDEAETADADQSAEEGSKPDGQKTEKRKLKRPRSNAARKNTPWITTGIIVGSALVVGVIASSGGGSDGSPNR